MGIGQHPAADAEHQAAVAANELGDRVLVAAGDEAVEELLVAHAAEAGSDQVADVTGAGDTVIAAFTAALAAGANAEEAAHLANYAGGVVVMKRGTATVSRTELLEAIRRDAGGSGS